MNELLAPNEKGRLMASAGDAQQRTAGKPEVINRTPFTLQSWTARCPSGENSPKQRLRQHGGQFSAVQLSGRI